MKAALVLRLLLAASDHEGHEFRWSEIPPLSGYPGPVDGWTSWPELVELRPGHAVERLPTAASGRVDARTAEALRVVLRDPVQCFPSSEWDEHAQLSRPRDGGVARTAGDALDGWCVGGFSGRAASPSLVIEAPAYADSLLVTCAPDVARRLVSAGAEAFEVTRARPIPLWTD